MLLLDNVRYRGLSWSHLRWMLTTLYGHTYQPLSWLSFAVDHALWGMNPFGYHLSNLLLHSCNAVLFYFVVRRLLGRAMPDVPVDGSAIRLSSAFAALLFSIHPLRVESVAWITERKDVLSGFFFLAALLVYIDAWREPSCPEPARRGAMPRVWLLFVLSLLAKPMAMTFPALLILLDIYPLRRLPADPRQWLLPGNRSTLFEKIPFLLASAAIGLVVMRAIAPLQPYDDHGLASGLQLSLFDLSFYPWKTIFPFHLQPLYQIPPDGRPSLPLLLASGSAALVLTIAAFFSRHRWPAVTAAWAYYLICVSPTLAIFQKGPHAAADRYSYLPCLSGATLAGAAALCCLHRGRLGARKPLAAALAVALGGCGMLTWRQSKIWRDSVSLWRKCDERSDAAHAALATLFFQQGRLSEAILEGTKALALNPGNMRARLNLGNHLLAQRRFAEATAQYRAALMVRDDAVAHSNIGLALSLQGRSSEAIAEYKAALRLSPEYLPARCNLAEALLDRGDTAEAIRQYRFVLALSPSSPLGHRRLADALSIQGSFEDAIAEYRAALALKPDDIKARSNLASALLRSGRREEALAEYRQAASLRLVPASPEPLGPDPLLEARYARPL